MGDGTALDRRTEVQVLLLLCENNCTVPNTLILPIAERWTMLSQGIQALDVFKMHCLRAVRGTTRADRM